MGQHLELTRQFLEATSSRSWQTIWQNEIRPQLDPITGMLVAPAAIDPSWLDRSRYSPPHSRISKVSKGGNPERYTPPERIFPALECRFDLDPASPGKNLVPWIPAEHHYSSGGLQRRWFGYVFLNPPYGLPIMQQWLRKFIDHGNGIALVKDQTSTQWWQECSAHANAILFLNKKIVFVRPDSEEANNRDFPIGHHLVAIGGRARGVEALRNGERNGLGIIIVR
jgi:hypothetical protein